MVAEWQVGQVLWTMIWFTLFFLWIWLVVRVFVDIFRSHDMGGVAKAAWTFFVIVLPYLGVLSYLLIRGRGMAERDMRAEVEREQATRAYIREAAATPAPSGDGAGQLAVLADLRDRGAIDEEEYQQMKAKIRAA